MSIDTRENILKRLLAVSQAASGFKTAVRNRGLLDTEKRPAVVLLDGDETPVLTHGGRSNRAHSGRSFYPATPVVMQMRPEIYILLEEKARVVTATDTIGPAVNAKRADLVRAITEDEQLQALLGANGTMIYNGCATDLKSGGSLSGQLRLDFLFNYVYFPTTSNQGIS